MSQKTRTTKPTAAQRTRATAQKHWDAAKEPGKCWWEWKKLCHCRACLKVRGAALERALAGP